MRIVQVILWLLLEATNLRLGKPSKDGVRLYEEGHQFPAGSEHLVLPEILAFSVYMGKLKHPHMALTLESMRWNPKVQFVVINIVPDGSAKTTASTNRGRVLQESSRRLDDVDSSSFPKKPSLSGYAINLARKMHVDNFRVVTVTYSQFSDRVFDKLGIRVAYNQSWYYKMTDYKPTMAHLFPEIVNERKYAFWGYVDLDLLWGNFSRFAHLFQGDYAVVTSVGLLLWISYYYLSSIINSPPVPVPRPPLLHPLDFQGASGVCMLFKNEDWTKTLFKTGPKYVELLTHHADYQLDEFSHKGLYEDNTMDRLIANALKEKGLKSSGKGRHWKEKLWLDSEGAITWAGPARWFRGTVSSLRGCAEFPPGHEYLIFHRPNKGYDIASKFPRRMFAEIEQDMMKYGYLLPNWVPLATRHICVKAASEWMETSTALEVYQPYKVDCFGYHQNPSKAQRTKAAHGQRV